MLLKNININELKYIFGSCACVMLSGTEQSPFNFSVRYETCRISCCYRLQAIAYKPQIASKTMFCQDNKQDDKQDDDALRLSALEAVTASEPALKMAKLLSII